MSAALPGGPRIRSLAQRTTYALVPCEHYLVLCLLSPLRFDGPFPDELVVALRRDR
jgi:hypothetical protein